MSHDFSWQDNETCFDLNEKDEKSGRKNCPETSFLTQYSQKPYAHKRWAAKMFILTANQRMRFI